MTTITPQGGMAARNLDIGRVGQDLFGLIQKDPVGTVGLAAGLSVIPAALTLILTLMGVITAGPATGAAALARFAAMGPWLLVVVLVGLLTAVLIYSALGWGAVQGLEGRTPTVGEKISAAGAALLPTVGIAVLAYIGIFVASIFLLVPGIILAMVWSMVIVAEVVDRSGVIGSFGRSAALTKTHRWTIFLLALIYVVGVIVVRIVESVVIGLGAIGGVAVLAIVSAFVQIVVGGLVSAVAGVGAGVVYHQLRALKGEFDPGRLNRVFG